MNDKTKNDARPPIVADGCGACGDGCKEQGCKVERESPPAVAQQAEPVALDDDMVLISRGLIGAACAAIDKKRDAPMVLSLLRDVAMSKAAHPPAEPVARDVLMALAAEIRDAVIQEVTRDNIVSITGAVVKRAKRIDLNAIVDHYAAQPPAMAVPDRVVDAVMLNITEAWRLGQAMYQYASKNSGKAMARAAEIEQDFERLKDRVRAMLAAAPQAAVKGGA